MQLAQARARSGIQLLTAEPGHDPISAQKEINGLMRLMARYRVARSLGRQLSAEMTAQQFAEWIAALPETEYRLVLDTLESCRDGYYKLTNFAYPKLANIDVDEKAVPDVQANIQMIERVIVHTNGDNGKVINGTSEPLADCDRSDL
jgi:hypothetical protein